MRTSRRPARLLPPVLGLLCVAGTVVPGHADEHAPVPGSCAPHHRHLVNPGCVPAATGDVVDPGLTLPNISPDVRDVAVTRPNVLDPATQTFVPGPLQLRFDTWVRNLGTVPLELVSDDPVDPRSVLQCVSWTTHACRETREVGEFAWHEEHSHFHYQDFADYQLRRLATDGRPDYSDAGLLAVSEKVSFCLVDAGLLSLDDPQPPFYLTCLQVVQGVSPGWADVYATGTPGQEFEIEGLPDGRYVLIVSMDRSNRVHEADDTDNVVEITVQLGGGGTQVEIVGRRFP